MRYEEQHRLRQAEIIRSSFKKGIYYTALTILSISSLCTLYWNMDIEEVNQSYSSNISVFLQVFGGIICVFCPTLAIANFLEVKRLYSDYINNGESREALLSF